MLVPVAPEPVLLRTIGNVAAGSSFRAQFSLPFGMIANITQDNRPPVNQHPSLFALDGGAFELVQPSFASGAGAFQLMLKPPNPTEPDAKFGGSTTLSTDGASPGYGARVLGSDGDVVTIFQDEFSNGGGVPVLRADLAGYGASIWSEWVKPNAKGTQIIKVQFGRCAHWARPSRDVAWTQTAPIARRWQPETPPNDPEKTMTPRRTAETECHVSAQISAKFTRTTCCFLRASQGC
jgi:hypothetical protein